MTDAQYRLIGYLDVVLARIDSGDITSTDPALPAAFLRSQIAATRDTLIAQAAILQKAVHAHTAATAGAATGVIEMLGMLHPGFAADLRSPCAPDAESSSAIIITSSSSSRR